MGNSFTKYSNIDEGIIVINSKGDTLYNNNKVEEIFSRKDNFPKNIFTLIPDGQTEFHRSYIKTLKYGMSNKYIKYNIHDKLVRTLNITIIPKSFRKIMLIIKDLTHEVIYKEFFRTTKHFICTLSSDFTLTRINPYMHEKLEYDESHMINKSFVYFIHKDDLEHTYAELHKIGENYQNCTITNRYKTHGGKYIYLEWNIKYIDSENIFCIASDVTDAINHKSRLELSESFLNQTEELIDSGVWDWNINTNQLTWSNGLKHIYEIDEVNMNTYTAQNHVEDQDTIQHTINKCLIDEKPYIIIHRVVGAKTGRIKYVKARGAIVKILNERRLVGVVQDITDIVMNEKTLLELKDKAIKNDTIKSSFIANVSHELRTPLNGIIGITELLKNTSGLNPKQEEYINTLDHSCGLLLSIINNVLDFSKLEKNETNVEITEINIRNFIETHTKLFKYNIERKNLYFDLKVDEEVPTIIKSDEIKLKQIIYNLLSNSLKFTMKGGISIHLFIIDDKLRIDIKDTGVGIEHHNQKNIFEPFIQADISTTRKYGGTGLGLTICRSYVNLLKGTISFTSEVNIGTVFTTILPIDYMKKNDFDKYKTTQYITIVEDNVSNQYILSELIKNIYPDIFIEIFENGFVCMNNISFDNPPAIIFMDIHMPVMDGYSCTTALREKGLTCDIIGISANHMSNERSKCLKVGMDNFILKPIDKELLQSILMKRIPVLK